MADEWKDLEGAELAGLRLERYLAHGGQAAVFVGVNEARRSERRAIKVVAPHLARDESFKRRFLEEAEALERLSHPNIVGFRDVRIAPAMRGGAVLRDGQPFMVLEMELLEGRTLREVAESQTRASVEDALEWCAQACEGLAEAHAHGIVHRDVTPGNVFVCNDGVVKVIDFGIAQAISRADADSKGRLTKTGHTAGTPLYIAPELWNGSEASAQADIYALGLTLAHVLLGRHPFVGEDGHHPSDFQVMHRHTQEDLRGKLAKPNLRLHQAVEDLVMLLCARDPGQRPGSAAAATEEIRAVRGRLLYAQGQHSYDSITMPAGVRVSSPRQVAPMVPSQPLGTSPGVERRGSRRAATSESLEHASLAFEAFLKASASLALRYWWVVGLLVGTFTLAVGVTYAVEALTSRHGAATSGAWDKEEAPVRGGDMRTAPTHSDVANDAVVEQDRTGNLGLPTLSNNIADSGAGQSDHISWTSLAGRWRGGLGCRTRDDMTILPGPDEAGVVVRGRSTRADSGCIMELFSGAFTVRSLTEEPSGWRASFARGSVLHLRPDAEPGRQVYVSDGGSRWYLRRVP